MNSTAFSTVQLSILSGLSGSTNVIRCRASENWISLCARGRCQCCLFHYCQCKSQSNQRYIWSNRDCSFHSSIAMFSSGRSYHHNL